MTEIARMWATIGADVSGLNKGLAKAEKDITSFGKAMSGVQSVISTGLKVAVSAGVAAVGGLTVGMAKAVSEAGNLEQQAANISAVFGNMAPPVEEVKGLINDLALDPKLVVGVGEAGANLEMLAKNGLSWQEIAGGAARSSTLLANATGADMATASDIATNAMGIFGLGVGQLDNVVATFVNTANSSQFGVEDLGFAMANAGPKAAAFGFSLEELFAGISLTSSGFASGQNAGTSWAWMINGLVPNTDKASDAMKELGLITENGANAFFNADGTGKDLASVVGLLQGSFGKLSTEQQMSYSRTIFGNEAYGALSGVLGMNIDQLNELIPKMTDFSAVEAGAATRTNTYQASMAALSDTINSVFAMIGDKFLPIFTKMSRGFADFIKDNAKPVIDFFGRFADSLTVFGSIFSVQTAVLTSANASWSEKMVAVWDMVSQVGSKIWGSLADNISGLAPKLLENIGKWASGLWEWIVDSIPTALEKLGEWAGKLWKWLVDNLPTWASNLWEWAKATWQWIVDVTPEAITQLGKWGSALWGWLSTNAPTWATNLGIWGKAAWQWIVMAVPLALTELGKWGAALWGWLTANAPTWATNLGKWGAAAWEWLVAATTTAVGKLGLWGTALWGWLATNAPTWASNLADWATAAWQWIVDATPTVVEKLGAWGSAIWGWLVANGPSWLGPLGEWTVGAWQWIADAVAPVLTQLGAWGGAIWGWLTANGPTWTNRLTEWGNAANGFITAIGTTVTAIGTIFAPIADAITQFVSWKDVLLGSAIALGIIFAPAIVGAIGAALAPLAGFIAAWAPVLAIFAASIIAVALFRTAWETDWGGIQTKTQGVIDYVQGRFGPLFNTIKDFGVQALAEIALWATGNETEFAAVNTIVDKAKETFGLMWDDFATRFPETATAVETAWTSVTEATGAVSDYVGEKTAGLTQAITDFGVDSLVEIGKWATGQETEFTATKTIWNAFKDTVTELTGDLVETVLPPFATWLSVTFPASVNDASIAMGILEGSFAFFARESGTSIGQVEMDFTLFIEGLKATLDSGFGLMLISASSFVSNMALSILALDAAISLDWETFWGAMDMIQANSEKVRLAEARLHINAMSTLMGAGGKDITEGFGKGLDSGVGPAKTKMGEFSDQLKRQFTDDFGIHSPSTVFRGYGQNVVAGFSEGFASRWNSFVSSSNTTVGGWINWFKGVFGIHSPSTVFEGFGLNIVTGLADGIDGAKGMAFGALDNLSAGMNMDVNSGEMAYTYSSDSENSTEEEMVRLLRIIAERIGVGGNTTHINMQGYSGDTRSDITAANAFLAGLKGAR